MKYKCTSLPQWSRAKQTRAKCEMIRCCKYEYKFKHTIHMQMQRTNTNTHHCLKFPKIVTQNLLLLLLLLIFSAGPGLLQRNCPVALKAAQRAAAESKLEIN